MVETTGETGFSPEEPPAEPAAPPLLVVKLALSSVPVTNCPMVPSSLKFVEVAISLPASSWSLSSIKFVDVDAAKTADAPKISMRRSADIRICMKGAVMNRHSIACEKKNKHAHFIFLCRMLYCA